jgi:hypothetical protein
MQGVYILKNVLNQVFDHRGVHFLCEGSRFSARLGFSARLYERSMPQRHKTSVLCYKTFCKTSREASAESSIQEGSKYPKPHERAFLPTKWAFLPTWVSWKGGYYYDIANLFIFTLKPWHCRAKYNAWDRMTTSPRKRYPTSGLERQTLGW